LPDPTVPTTIILPTQEKGTKKSRALPYQFVVNSYTDPNDFRFYLTISNIGQATGMFYIYDLLNTPLRDKSVDPPRKYTVEGGQKLSDFWLLTSSSPSHGGYSLSLHGPNGYVRQLSGNVSYVNAKTNPEIAIAYDVPSQLILLTFNNTGGALICSFTLTFNAYRADGPLKFAVNPNSVLQSNFSVASSGNWYDFTVTTPDGGNFIRRAMGRLETGKDSITDPAMGGVM